MASVAAIHTQGDAHAAPLLSVKRMKGQIDRLPYLAEKVPRFSAELVPRRENATCRYIRDLLYPLLDDEQRRKVIIAQVRYLRAVGMVETPDELGKRIAELGNLLKDAQKEGKIEGERLGAWEKARLEGEALALKKRGTAALRLFLERGESEYIYIAEKSLQSAHRRWERLRSEGSDHAKVLYWLALAKYGMEKDEEAAACAEKCVKMCEGNQELSELHFKAKDVLARARMEINRDLLTR
jgi:hypothetical protein